MVECCSGQNYYVFMGKWNEWMAGFVLFNGGGCGLKYNLFEFWIEDHQLRHSPNLCNMVDSTFCGMPNYMNISIN